MPLTLDASRDRLIGALDLLNSLRPLLDNKDAVVWDLVWAIAYAEALAAARAFEAAANGVAK